LFLVGCGGTWTADRDGYCLVDISRSATGSAGNISFEVLVDDTRVFYDERIGIAANSWIRISEVVKIAKGQTIKLLSYGITSTEFSFICRFIPPLFSVTEQTPLATDYYDISGETLALEPNTDWIAPYDCKIGIWVSINPAATAPQTASLKLIADGSTLFEDTIILGNSNASRVFIKDAILYKGQTFSYEVNSGAATYQKALSIHPRKYKSVTPQEFQYSTDEKWAGKYWIDGRKIYAKAFNELQIGDISDLEVGNRRVIPLINTISGFDRIINNQLQIEISQVTDRVRLGAPFTALNEVIDRAAVFLAYARSIFIKRNAAINAPNQGVFLHGYCEYTKA
jgi:hypothetical protein